MSEESQAKHLLDGVPKWLLVLVLAGGFGGGGAGVTALFEGHDSERLVKIEHKLDRALSKDKQLEERVSKIEKRLDEQDEHTRIFWSDRWPVLLDRLSSVESKLEALLLKDNR